MGIENAELWKIGLLWIGFCISLVMWTIVEIKRERRLYGE